MTLDKMFDQLVQNGLIRQENHTPFLDLIRGASEAERSGSPFLCSHRLRLNERHEAAGGTEMKFSAEFDRGSLSVEQKKELKEFYSQQLRGQFVRWPLRDHQIGLYKDGTICPIYGAGDWDISDGYIYVGYSSSKNVSVDKRLGVLVGLMGATGHSEDEELQMEFAQALGKMLSGLYRELENTFVKGTREIKKLAFSERGSAAWMDDQWVGPNGDLVVVGEDWTVCEVERGGG